MKTTNKFARLLKLTAVMFVFLFASKQGKAQTYVVNNNLGCDVIINWTWNDRPNCTTCASSTGVVIAVGNSLSIPQPASCGPLCDMKIVLVNVGGVALSPVGVVSSSSTTDAGSVSGSACSVPSWNMIWSSTQTDINP